VLRKDIAKYTYSPKDLRNNLRKDDFWKYDLKPEKIQQETERIANKFARTNGSIQELKKQKLRGNLIFTTGTLYDALTIRRTNEIIKSTFSIKICSRDEEIKQIRNIIISERPGTYIFRTDIKSFFDKLPFFEIVERLFSQNLVTKNTYNHLVNIFKETSTRGTNGLPRGLCISSSLSEYALHDFDHKILSSEYCLYYARYVDDIALLTSNEIDNIESRIEKKLPFDLKLNKQKTVYKQIGIDNSIEYLGYFFSLKDACLIKIADKKLNKIKKRIILSLRCYLYKDKNFLLLADRLKFLSGNTILRMANRKKPITVGLRYQYQFCDNKILKKQLISLDTFMRRIIFSKKYQLSKKLNQNITLTQRRELLKISFLAGYEKKITKSLDRERVATIKAAWRYE
jgi:hypothetical protein